MASAEIRSEPLNAVDQLTLAGHDFLRSIGYAGFLNQRHLWLAGRVDQQRLQCGIARLSARYPIMTSRLVYLGRRAGYHWQYRDSAVSPLNVAVLDESDGGAVLRHAERLMAAPLDLANTDPISFHLVRRPSGGDVLIIQFDQSLMDGVSAGVLTRELGRLCEEDSDGAATRLDVPADPVEAWVLRHPRRARVGAALRLARSNLLSASGKPVTLLPQEADSSSPGTTRLAIHTLDETQTMSLVERVRRTQGFPSISMALAASVFRALQRATPQTTDKSSVWRTALGTDVRGPGDRHWPFHNVVSQLILAAREEDLHDRDTLTTMLNRQFRDRLRERADLGALQLARFVKPLPVPRPRAIDHMLRHENSLIYGYFGTLVEPEDQLAGVPIERAAQFMLAWHPPGLALGANLSRGRLVLSASFTADVVSEARMDQFFAALVDDLIA